MTTMIIITVRHLSVCNSLLLHIFFSLPFSLHRSPCIHPLMSLPSVSLSYPLIISLPSLALFEPPLILSVFLSICLSFFFRSLTFSVSVLSLFHTFHSDHYQRIRMQLFFEEGVTKEVEKAVSVK